MKKLAIGILCCAILFAGCGTISGTGTRGESLQNQPGIDLTASLKSMPPNSDIACVLYTRGYDSLDELMVDYPLVVRATPVSVENESPIGACLLLEVAEASQSGIKTVRVRQVKDENRLKLGEEVVLALHPTDDGVCDLPPYGCGVYRANSQTGIIVSGWFLDSLREDAPGKDLTLEDVFNLLTEKAASVLK